MSKLPFPIEGFLPQTGFVEDLLREVATLMTVIPDSGQKRRVLMGMEPFRRVIVPSALGIEEVNDRLMQELGYANPLDAADILLDVSYDVDLNYATYAIEYHVDEFLSDKIP